MDHTNLMNTKSIKIIPGKERVNKSKKSNQ